MTGASQLGQAKFLSSPASFIIRTRESRNSPVWLSRFSVWMFTTLKSGGTVSGIAGHNTNWVCLWLSSRAVEPELRFYPITTFLGICGLRWEGKVSLQRRRQWGKGAESLLCSCSRTQGTVAGVILFLGENQGLESSVINRTGTSPPHSGLVRCGCKYSFVTCKCEEMGHLWLPIPRFLRSVK